MKKLATTLLALALSAPLALGACSSPAPETPEDDSKPVETTTEKKDETTDDTTDDGKDETTDDSNTDDIVGWGIKIAVPDGTTAALEDEEYYIYTRDNEQFPYVMVTVYNMDRTGEEFLAEFTDYMEGEYDDFKVVEEPADVTIGDKKGTKTVYEYTAGDYVTRDTRVVVPKNGRVYMFATKAVDELDLAVDDDVFEQVIEDAVIYKAE